jgi:hypothetical protein
MDTQVTEIIQTIHSLIEYAAEIEALVLTRHGLPLTTEQLADARLVGVHDPDRIRLANSFVFVAADPRFAALLDLEPALAGLTVGYAIILNSNQAGKRDVFLHECAHVAQCERLGLQGFLRQYFAEIAFFGYGAAPLEQEAVATVRKINRRFRPTCGEAQ